MAIVIGFSFVLSPESCCCSFLIDVPEIQIGRVHTLECRP